MRTYKLKGGLDHLHERQDKRDAISERKGRVSDAATSCWLSSPITFVGNAQRTCSHLPLGLADTKCRNEARSVRKLA